MSESFVAGLMLGMSFGFVLGLAVGALIVVFS